MLRLLSAVRFASKLVKPKHHCYASCHVALCISFTTKMPVDQSCLFWLPCVRGLPVRVWVLVLWYSVLEEKIGVGTWYSMKFGVGPGTRKVVFWSIGTWYSGNITPITAQELGLNMTYCPSARVVVRLVESEESGNLHLAVNPNSKFNCIGFIRLRRLVV